MSEPGTGDANGAHTNDVRTNDADSNGANSNVTILDVPEWARFEIHVDGKLAGFATYRIAPGVITFTHTEIDEAYGGRGLGGTLVRAALDTARARRLGVLPECPFVRRWISRHPDYVDLVPEDERARFDL
jgi:predicted GNAT family acetyltransferase